MIKMTYQQVSGFEFTRAMQKLAQTPMSTKVAYNIKKLADAMNKQREVISQEYQRDIVDKYAKKDEKGELVRPEGQPQGFDIDAEKVEEFQKVQEDFGKREFTIERFKLTLADLEQVKLSASELTALEPIYQEHPVDTTEGNVVPMNA